MLTTIVDKFSNQVAFQSDSGHQFFYSEFNSLIDRVKSVITQRALVFCLTKNSINSIAGCLALMEAKAVPLLLDSKIDEALLRTLVDHYQPNYIFQPKSQTHVGDYQIVLSIGEYDLVSCYATPCTLHPNLALLMTTSGSTGSPKLVRLSKRNIWSNAESISDFLKLTEQERPITVLPFYYSYGLSVINSHLYVGSTILVTDTSIMQREFWDFTRSGKATSIAGVPYTYEMLRRIKFFSMDLPDLNTMTQAGGKLAPKIVDEFLQYANSHKKRFIVMYGQTEATARMSFLPFECAALKPNSIGIPIPGGDFFLLGDSGELIVEHDVIGNLFYRGPNVCMGYANCKSDLNLDDVQRGVLDTGDLASMDADNFYYIQGRKSRFAKIYGNRVSLDEVENLLKKITSECACIGLDDKIAIFITELESKEKISIFLTKKLRFSHQSFMINVVSHIPKNTFGKIQYTKLQDLL